MAAKSTGFTMLPHWLIRNPEYLSDKNTFLVYLVLLDHRDHRTGLCNPSIKTIGSESRTSEKTARRALKSLEELGLIEIQRRPKANGDWQTNRYKVALPTAVLHPPTGVVPEGATGVVADKEEPITSSTKEEDVRSNFGEIGRASPFSHDIYDDRATSRQLTMLRDYHIHCYNEPPNESREELWQSMSVQDASDLIAAYQRELPRHDEWEGAESGDEAYEFLSVDGREFADNYGLPR
ncbi:helix-turn-helix domain-containing protein [Agromyces sp. NPDC056965]|uniref:helix-turn-helix domain-containing protein n=1 Tax=Agromyces sp. NPDC056965 TaxID=3345983 RepID=UPI00363D4B63